MTLKEGLKSFWTYLKKDTWDAWLVSLILIIILIKFVVFPLLSLATGSQLPLVVVESCSMYHDSSLQKWWSDNSEWYSDNNISKEEFSSYPLKNGLNKGDIVIVWGYSENKKGDIIIFTAGTQYPLIHRIVSLDPLQTKGDNNPSQISNLETNINPNQIIGKAAIRIPYLGWIKLIFFDIFKPENQRGFCH